MKNYLPDHYIQPTWPAPPHIKAICTTRCHEGGYSQAPYDQFNLALHVDDDPIAVEQNQQLLIQELTLPHSPLWLNQVHNTHALKFTHELLATTLPYSIAADACYTQASNIVCAIMTADCV